MATPLQTMLQIDVLPRDTRTVVESVLVLVGMLGAFAVRRRRRAVTATTFLLLSGSALIDAGSRFIPNPLVGEKVAVAAFVLFLFGVIRLVLEFVDSITRRGKVHFSTISKDLLMLTLWFVVVMVVLYTDFGVQPLSILTTTTVFAAVLGFARDEITVGISYGVPPNHVREVVLTLLRDVPQVLHDPPPEVLAWNYSDSAIEYRIKYSIADYGVLEHVRDRVASGLWYALRRHSIEIPFPMRTVHLHDAREREEDKADADFERELMADLRQVDWMSGLSD